MVEKEETKKATKEEKKVAPKAEKEIIKEVKVEKKVDFKKEEKTVDSKEEVKKENSTSTEKKPFVPREKRDFGRKGFDRRRDFSKEKYETQEFKKPVFVKKISPFKDYKIFNKWDTQNIIIEDLSLVSYINLDPVIIPHSFGRKSQGRFAKVDINIIERLINKVMRSGQGKRKLSGKYIRGRHGCGKKMQAMQIVKDAFEVIEQKTNENPVQILVRAIENVAPREDITRIKRGGVAYSIAVDVSPMKRLDEAIKNIALAGFGNSFNTRLSAGDALAEEIIAAAKGDSKSIGIKRRDEVERIAKASR